MEDQLGFSEQWYLFGIRGFSSAKTKEKYSLWQEWQEEQALRSQIDKPIDDQAFLKQVRQEQERGIKWVCEECDFEYYVKTPFLSLCCPQCLKELQRGERILLVNKKQWGYWMFEE